MFQRRFPYLSALLVALFVFIAPLTALAQGPLTEEFTSSSGALTLLHPAGWVYQEDTGLVALANDASAFESPELLPGMIGVIVVEPSLVGTMVSADVFTLDDALAELASQMSNGELDAATLSPERITFDGRPASRLVTSTSANDLLLLGIELDAQNTVIVVGMIPPGELAEVEPTVNAIAETIEYTPQWHAMLTSHTDWVRAVAFSPDGTQVASGADDMTILLWDVASGEEVAMLSHPDWVYGLAYSPDGTLLASIGSTSLYLWDLVSVELAQEMEVSLTALSSVAFSPDGSLIATGGDDMIIRLWALDDLSQEPAVIEGNDGSVLALAFSPDGSRIVSGGGDSSARVWDIDSGAELLSIEHPDWIRGVDFSADGTLILTGSDDGVMRVFDAETGDTVAELPGHTDWIRGVAFGPDSTQAVSGSDDGTVILWAFEDGEWQQQAVFAGHIDWVRSVAFSPDGTLVASGSDDRAVILWDVP